MVEQRVHQRAGVAAGGRVDDHADRLVVDDDELVVLVKDIERDVLRLGIGIDRLGATSTTSSPAP